VQADRTRGLTIQISPRRPYQAERIGQRKNILRRLRDDHRPDRYGV